MEKNIGIIGLGTVGESTVRSLCKYSKLIEKRTSLNVVIRKVCDSDNSKRRVATKFSLPFTSNPYDIINDPTIDTVVELIGGVSPAKEYIIESLKKGKNVVTANKALLAQEGKELFNLSYKVGRNIGFEASVCAAIPLIRSISEGLVGCEVKKLYGILNGTTNYILSRMHKEGISFYTALKEAQNKGIAERIPNLDIDGIDTLHKLAILTYLCFDLWPSLKDISVEGISRISNLDILYAQELSYVIKLLAIAKREKNKLDLRVHPTLIPKEHPLSQVSSTFNGVWVEAEPAGELLFYGQGAGGMPTSSAVISDIVNTSFLHTQTLKETDKFNLENIKNLRMRYYIRFMAVDKPGVLAKISKILASLNISIASVTQKERKKGKFVPIVMITHEAKELDVRIALSKIDRLDVIQAPSQLIRIDEL
ncbi:MAG: homoserine dehydrogenase [Candidatus Omnitrophica bacterium]|nr:homoserine dehydrogenase [Candidatus Omnitrophota bacterium]